MPERGREGLGGALPPCGETVRRFALASVGQVIGPGVRGPKDKELRGRVDLTNGSFSFILYCYVDPSGEESWIILDDRTFQSRPVSREAFEAALVSLLG